jgi:hypothetical protein
VRVFILYRCLGEADTDDYLIGNVDYGFDKDFDSLFRFKSLIDVILELFDTLADEKSSNMMSLRDHPAAYIAEGLYHIFELIDDLFGFPGLTESSSENLVQLLLIILVLFKRDS